MFQVYDLYLLGPELSLTLLALLVILVDLFIKRFIVTTVVAFVGLLIPLGILISQAATLNFTQPHRAFYGMLVVDPYAIFFGFVFLFIAFMMILMSYRYIQKYVRSGAEFYMLLLFSITGMMLMASTGELISIYISYELASIPLYVMAGLLRQGERSAEAAVKYVLLGAMSSAILLYGFALLYGLTGTTDLMGIAAAIRTGVAPGNPLLMVASVLILAGFGFKISAVPFHMWAPDIYEGSPTVSTAFFSVGSKAAGFAALIRVFIDGGLGQVNYTSLLIIFCIVAILTMTFGNIVAAVQTNVKRLMAYSSIAQAGYILIGVIASLSDKNANGISASLFFIAVYVVTNLGAFSGIIALANATGGERLEDFRGLARRSPLVAACTALCLLSLAGIPPLAGFMSKVFIFTAVWGQNLGWLVVIALLNTVVSLVYYGNIVRSMYFDAPPKPDYFRPSPTIATSITVATAGLLVLFFGAQLLLAVSDPSAGSLLAFLVGK
ncbi:MAG TPA: NADH-quinone oxidoreductase subunit N [Ktedonobacteraceae bacterium]|nr:NADH-quinone oxidoreductase subunit N [Ktedonobacteraceae bacterium]